MSNDGVRGDADDTGSGHLGPDERDAVVRSLLADHPAARVVAIDDFGFFREMPTSVPLAGQSALVGRTALDVVVAEDRTAIISAWSVVRERGASQVEVRLPGPPIMAATIHFVDVRHRHGVYLAFCVVDGWAGASADDSASHALVVRPRSMRWLLSQTAVVQEVDDATQGLLGYPKEEVVGLRSIELIHPDDHSMAIDVWLDMLVRPGMARRSRLRHRHADGNWIWIESVADNRLADPQYGYVIVEKFDISEEMAAHEALRAREQLLNRLAEALPLGVVQIDLEGNVLYANDRLGDVLGRDGASLAERLGDVLAADRPLVDAAVESVLAQGRDQDLELRLRRPGDRETRRAHLSVRPLTHDDGSVTGAIACVSDITDSVRLREELHERATYDPLTRCYNRAAILAELERVVGDVPPAAVVQGYGGSGAIFIDVDLFKSVNDRFGHAVGDELLRVVADRLRGTLRDDDLLGRLGGDEFLVVCPRVTDARLAGVIGDRIADALTGDVALSAGSVPLRASIGVAWSPAGRTDAAGLVHEADLAMYASKRTRLGTAVVFDPELHRAA